MLPPEAPGDSVQVVLFVLVELGVLNRIERHPNARGVLMEVEDTGKHDVKRGVPSAGDAHCQRQRVLREGGIRRRGLVRYETC